VLTVGEQQPQDRGYEEQRETYEDEELRSPRTTHPARLASVR
jgi:hypothetical protein